MHVPLTMCTHDTCDHGMEHGVATNLPDIRTLYEGFLTWGGHFSGCFNDKPAVLGHPHFWKPALRWRQRPLGTERLGGEEVSINHPNSGSRCGLFRSWTSPACARTRSALGPQSPAGRLGRPACPRRSKKEVFRGSPLQKGSPKRAKRIDNHHIC